MKRPLKFAAFHALFFLLAAHGSTSQAVERPASVWIETRTMPAAEAVQAAAADERFVYAITNSQVAQYDRATGERLASSSGEARHLNSGFFWKGRLYLAHSNYPLTPERSEIKSLDPATMQLQTFKDFGDFGGSLTWVVRVRDHWWCNFAKYGEHNGETFLVQFDDAWHEVGRWTYPPELIKQLGSYSLSGGLWRGELLYVTGHDDPVVFRLRLPADGQVLELVDKQAVPFTGQGFAVDTPVNSLVGINRAKRQVVFATLEHPTPEPRLPRDQLLLFRGENNQPQPVKSPADWQRRRSEILRAAQSVMGELPGLEKRCSLEMKIEEEVDCGDYVRRLVTYASEPGSRVPAYLCVPKSLLESDGAARQAPAILCLHGTDNTVGHGTVVGLGSRPNRNYASELAERGYVTLAPNYPLLAKYQPDITALGWESGTLKAVWDNIRGIDLLQSLPFVQPGPVGAIGHSLGGHNSVYTATFDDRIQAVVTSCGLDSYLDYYDGNEQVWLPEKGWTQTRYMARLAGYRGRLEAIPYDFHELIGGLAPRHVLIVAPLKDSNFRAASVDRVAAAAREVYQLHGQPERLRVLHPDCEHDFPPEMRDEAYRLFDEVLKSPR
ncbi:MAG: prolyl oligopeptidase family serine peptidase [Pirellulaceae bacterium]